MESKDPIQLELPLSRPTAILIVDDDEDTRDLLKTFFSFRGYEVLTATDGREALAAIERNAAIEIVLLDVFLPAVGGLEVLKEIHKFDDSPTAIFLTALADTEVAHEAMRLGAFDYILKPIDLGRLEAAVQVCLDRREYRRQSWWKRLAS